MASVESKKKSDLNARTKAFALRIFKPVDALPQTLQGRMVAKQIVRSATSVAANVAIMASSRKSAVANRHSPLP
jgi:four helix bundle protein